MNVEVFDSTVSIPLHSRQLIEINARKQKQITNSQNRALKAIRVKEI